MDIRNVQRRLGLRAGWSKSKVITSHLVWHKGNISGIVRKKIRILIKYYRIDLVIVGLCYLDQAYYLIFPTDVQLGNTVDGVQTTRAGIPIVDIRKLLHDCFEFRYILVFIAI